MAYILGYFAADGSMYINRHGAKYVGFTSTDPVLLEAVKTLLKSEHAIRPKRQPVARWKPIYQIQIGGDELFDNLRRLGFTPNKEGSVRLPRVPSTCASAFVRGYFDGDGCVSFGWYQKRDRRNPSFWVQVCFASGCLRYLRDLDRLLQREAGLAAGYLRWRPIGCYLYYQRRPDLRRLYRFLYPAGLPEAECLQRKYEHFAAAATLLGT